MVEREVLKDINSYKAKFIGPLTLRNFVCIAIAAAIAIPVYLILNIWFVPTFCMLVSAIFAAPALMCGFYQPYGEPLEKFVVTFIKQSVIAPTNRPYEVENSFEEFKDDKFEPVKLDKKARKNYEAKRTAEGKKLGADWKPIR